MPGSVILPPVAVEGGRSLKRIVLISCLILVIFWASGYAVEPTTKPEETTPQSELLRSREQGGPLPFPEQMVVGEVTGSTGKPIGGVTVKLFADGRLVEVGHTTSAGSYEMRLPLSVERDETVVMWFASTTGNLMPQCVVLKKSSSARKASLFSECTLEVKMRPQMRVDVTLMTESEMVASLKMKNCL